MRFSLVGRGADGRSTVVETKVVDLPVSGDKTIGVSVAQLWFMAADAMRPLTADHPAQSQWLDLGLAEGAMQWTLFSLTPGQASPMHHTDTLDCELVLLGEVTLVLGAGEVRLGPGDAALIPGLEHQWLAGPAGATLAAVLHGLPPRTKKL